MKQFWSMDQLIEQWTLQPDELPLLESKSDQYRLGFAYLNLKNTPSAKQAFTEAASVDSPYKSAAQGKLKDLAADKTGAGVR